MPWTFVAEKLFSVYIYANILWLLLQCIYWIAKVCYSLSYSLSYFCFDSLFQLMHFGSCRMLSKSVDLGLLMKIVYLIIDSVCFVLYLTLCSGLPLRFPHHNISLPTTLYNIFVYHVVQYLHLPYLQCTSGFGSSSINYGIFCPWRCL